MRCPSLPPHSLLWLVVRHTCSMGTHVDNILTNRLWPFIAFSLSSSSSWVSTLKVQQTPPRPSPSLMQSDMIELKAKKRLLELWGKDGPTEYGKYIYCRVSSRITTRKNAWLRKEFEGKVKELMRSKMMVGRYRATRCIKKKKQTQKIWAEALNRIEKDGIAKG